MLNDLLNIVPFVIAAYDSGLYHLDRRAIAEYIEAWAISKMRSE